MPRRARIHPNKPRVHAYAASFGEDFAYEVICESTKEGNVILDPFVGAGTTALESVLSNRNAIGIDIDPIACRISRVLTSRFDVPYLLEATEHLRRRVHKFAIALSTEPDVYQDLGPGSTFNIGRWTFRVPDEPAIAYWFDPSHMATLSVVREVVGRERDPLVRQAFEVAISSSIIRKWPNTLSNAMDIDHSRPHRPREPRTQTIQDQCALFQQVLDRVTGAIVNIQRQLESIECSANILEGNSVDRLSKIKAESVDFVLTSPPYLNAIDYPRAHKFSHWWLSPETPSLGRSEYVGLRQTTASDVARDCLLLISVFPELLDPFRDMPIFRNISAYILDLAAVTDQLYRVVRTRGRIMLVVADNVIAGTIFPVSAIIEQLLIRSGFSSVMATRRTINSTRRRYPFGIKGFAGPMKSEYLVTAVKSGN